MFGVSAARKGACMTTLLVALMPGTSAQGAAAGEPDCRAIESTSGRLACYDAAFPPKAKTPAAVENDVSRAPYKRSIRCGRGPNRGEAEEYLSRLLRLVTKQRGRGRGPTARTSAIIRRICHVTYTI